MVSGMFAITAVMKKEKPVEKGRVTLMETWEFTGTDPLDQSHYSDEEDPNTPCGFPFETICTIEAPDNGNNQPKLDELVYDEETDKDQTIEALIERAVNSLNSTPKTNVAVSDFRLN